jgi:hypothetical protein
LFSVCSRDVPRCVSAANSRLLARLTTASGRPFCFDLSPIPAHRIEDGGDLWIALGEQFDSRRREIGDPHEWGFQKNVTESAVRRQPVALRPAQRGFAFTPDPDWGED